MNDQLLCHRLGFHGGEVKRYRGPWWLHPEDGASMDLRNVGILPQHYTVSQPRRPRLVSSHK
jgi:hypothetical protein